METTIERRAGEVVQRTPLHMPAAVPGLQAGGWSDSSWELLQGLDVTECPAWPADWPAGPE